MKNRITKIKALQKAEPIFITLLQKVFIFEKDPQRIGLSQFKEVETPVEKKEASIKNKNVKFFKFYIFSAIIIKYVPLSLGLQVKRVRVSLE